ncbi:ribonuclease H-like domain-containing protein [Tanacetum coccineum]
MITRSQSSIVKTIDRLSLNTFSISHILKNPSIALKDPQWRNAIYDEYNGSEVAYLLIYVDDIILTASSTTLLQQIISSLHIRHSTGLFLSQWQYASKLLERAHMTNYNPSQTQVDTESKLGPEGVPVQDPTLYHNLAGGLSISCLLDRICPTRYSRLESYMSPHVISMPISSPRDCPRPCLKNFDPV